MLFGGSTALVGSGKSFAALLVYRILTGIGAGMIEPAAYAIAGDAYSYERRGRAMGIITSALIASSVIGVPLAGAISDLAFWRWTFWSIALLTVPVLAAALPAIPRSRPDREALKETGLVRQLRAAVSSRPTCVSLLGSFLYYGALQGMFSLAGVYYYTHFGLGPGKTGLVLLAAGAASILGSLLGGRWADHRRKSRVFAFAGAAAGFFVFALSLFTSSLWGAVALHILWAAAYAAGQPAFTVLVSELDPDLRGTVLSFNSSAMYAGASAMSALATVLLQSGSFWPIGLMCGAANLLAAAIAVAVLGQREKTGLARPQPFKASIG